LLNTALLKKVGLNRLFNIHSVPNCCFLKISSLVHILGQFDPLNILVSYLFKSILISQPMLKSSCWFLVSIFFDYDFVRISKSPPQPPKVLSVLFITEQR